MPENDYLDPFALKGVPAPQKKKSGGRGGAGGFVVVLVIVAALGGLGYLVWNLRPGAAQASPATPTASTPQTDTDREAVAVAEKFMLYYYNFSYNLHNDVAAKAKALMTPEMAADYNAATLASDFTATLNQYRVSTSAVRVDPGSVALNNQGDTYNVFMTGSIVYTTLTNNATGEFPLTVAVQLKKTAQGFLVSNIQRLK
jgi:hypothetical protein